MQSLNPQPLVSIYVATKNRSALLRLALESVFQQTYKNIEVVVVDDGSEDDTNFVLEEIARSEPRLRFTRFDESRGAPAARNKAIELARGEFVTGLDDDDLFCSNRIEDFVTAYEGSQCSFLCSLYVYKGEHGDVASFRRQERISFQQIKKSNVVGSQVFVRRASILELGGFDCSLKSWQDYDMWLRLIQKFGSAKRIDSLSYIVDQSVDRLRITASSNAHLGYLQFVEKHRGLFTKSEIALHRLNDLFNRNQPIALIELLSYLSRPACFLRASSVYLKCKHPKFYRALEKRSNSKLSGVNESTAYK